MVVINQNTFVSCTVRTESLNVIQLIFVFKGLIRQCIPITFVYEGLIIPHIVWPVNQTLTKGYTFITQQNANVVHRKLRLYIQDGGIPWVEINRNTVQQGNFVHRLSWTLSEGGAIPGFGCISLGILLSLVSVCFSSRTSSVSHSASSLYTSLSVNRAD